MEITEKRPRSSKSIPKSTTSFPRSTLRIPLAAVAAAEGGLLRKGGFISNADKEKDSNYLNKLPEIHDLLIKESRMVVCDDEAREEDEWLYGEGGSSSKSDPVTSGEGSNKERLSSAGDQQLESEIVDKEGISKDASESVPSATGEGDETAEGANNTHKEAESEEDDDEDDSSDDDDDDGVQVVIGDIKSSAGQSAFGVGGPGVKRLGPPPDKKGKFAVEDFETPGTINGVSALEFSIDGVEDKPWRKPGADITDYFNYGFTEETWKAYSDRQKRMRFEAGGPQIMNPTGKQDSRGVITVAFGQMQGQRSDNRRRDEPRENTIQVMTADRREYSRKNFEMGHPLPPPFDMSVPPPNFSGPPPGQDFMPNPEFFNHPPPQYYQEEHQGYEEQWMDHHTWDMEGMRGPPTGGPSSIVSLTKVSNVPPPPGDEDTGATTIKDERSK